MERLAASDNLLEPNSTHCTNFAHRYCRRGRGTRDCVESSSLRRHFQCISLYYSTSAANSDPIRRSGASLRRRATDPDLVVNERNCLYGERWLERDKSYERERGHYSGKSGRAKLLAGLQWPQRKRPGCCPGQSENSILIADRDVFTQLAHDSNQRRLALWLLQFLDARGFDLCQANQLWLRSNESDAGLHLPQRRPLRVLSSPRSPARCQQQC